MTKDFQVPGRLDSAPFVDFATTRNLALARSGLSCMYKLFIDGDWFLDGADELRRTLVEHLDTYRRLYIERNNERGNNPCSPECMSCYDGQSKLESRCTSFCTTYSLVCAPVLMIQLKLGKLSYFVPRSMICNSCM